MKRQIGIRIWTALFSLLLTLFILVGVSYRNARMDERNELWVSHTYAVITNIWHVKSLLEDAETGQRGYIITGQPSYLAPYRTALEGLHGALAQLAARTADDPVQKRRMRLLDLLAARKLTELKDSIGLRRTEGFSAAHHIVRLGTGKATMDKIRVVLRKMSSREQGLLTVRAHTEHSRIRQTLLMLLLGVLVASVLVVAGGLFLTASIFRVLSRFGDEIRETITVLTSSAAEILAATTQVAAGAAETASSVSETGTTVEEVKQAAQLSSQKAKQVSDSAQKAVQVAHDGRKAVEELNEGMNDVREQMEAVAESIVRLAEQSQAIGDITTTVGDLAEQSNLLAVNASIEAAKAGEHGAGFTVVAQEIKNLATQSKQATSQVRTILGDIQKATASAVMAAEKGTKVVEAGVKQSAAADDTIGTLATGVAEAAQAATQIAASSQQQLIGMDQVALAIDNIRQASTQNMASTRQAEASAHSLHELGQRLKDLIERYRV